MKKLISLITLLIPFTGFAVNHIKPENLQPGDTIAIISPSSVPDSTFVTEGAKIIKEWGYVPVLGKHVLAENGSYAGTAEQRLEDLKWAFETPSVKGIICSRGGNGSVQELCLLEPGYFAKYPKWIVGYSDISAIHSAMATDGVMSIHGHMCQYLRDFKGIDSLSCYLRTILTNGEITYNIKPSSKYGRYNKCGKAKGTLIGGNLSVVNDIADTRIDYMGKGKDLIIFLEDIGENIHSVSRIFYRLKLSGILERAKAIIIGSWTEYKPDDDYETMEDMIYDIVKDIDVPMVFDFPSGHQDANWPLIQGSEATIEITEDNIRLQMK